MQPMIELYQNIHKCAECRNDEDMKKYKDENYDVRHVDKWASFY